MYVEAQLKTVTVHSSPRYVLLWNKADFQHINDLMLQYVSDFISVNSVDTPVEQLWLTFKSICSACTKLVPYRLSSKSHSIAPWVTTYIKHLSRKKQRLYNKACASNLASDWSIYRNFKKYTQHECRRVRNQYFKHLLNPNSESGHKRLWTYIKSKRQDNIGIASLEDNSTIQGWRKQFPIGQAKIQIGMSAWVPWSMPPRKIHALTESLLRNPSEFKSGASLQLL